MPDDLSFRVPLWTVLPALLVAVGVWLSARARHDHGSLGGGMADGLLAVLCWVAALAFLLGRCVA